MKAFNHPDPDLGLRNAKHLAGLLGKAHPGAANSLREGLEEMFAVSRLGIGGRLAKTLVTSNPIESMISIARTTNRNVTRWRDSHMVLRPAAAGMLNAERSFRRINGYQQMPQLIEALHRHAHPQTASSTKTVGAAAQSSDRIATQVPRDSGHPPPASQLRQTERETPSAKNHLHGSKSVCRKAHGHLRQRRHTVRPTATRRITRQRCTFSYVQDPKVPPPLARTPLMPRLWS